MVRVATRGGTAAYRAVRGEGSVSENMGESYRELSPTEVRVVQRTEQQDDGSTLFFLNRCKKLITLEHDKEWIKKLQAIKINRLHEKKWSLIQKDLQTNINSNDFSPYLRF